MGSTRAIMAYALGRNMSHTSIPILEVSPKKRGWIKPIVPGIVPYCTIFKGLFSLIRPKKTLILQTEFQPAGHGIRCTNRMTEQLSRTFLSATQYGLDPGKALVNLATFLRFMDWARRTGHSAHMISIGKPPLTTRLVTHRPFNFGKNRCSPNLPRDHKFHLLMLPGGTAQRGTTQRGIRQGCSWQETRNSCNPFSKL